MKALAIAALLMCGGCVKYPWQDAAACRFEAAKAPGAASPYADRSSEIVEACMKMRGYVRTYASSDCAQAFDSTYPVADGCWIDRRRFEQNPPPEGPAH